MLLRIATTAMQFYVLHDGCGIHMYMSPVINNTLKVLQTVVLSLDEQYVTNLRFTALENTLRAILNVCFKIV